MMYNDRDLLAKTLMAEAGNQGPQGMLAVGSVIMNRANQRGYGDGIQGVIMKPGQFSPWNSVTGYAGGEQGQDMSKVRPTEEAYRIADALIAGQYDDPTGGATHFYNPNISQPKWGANGEWSRIGDHVFGKADAGRSTGGGTQMAGLLAPTISTSGTAEQPDQKQPFYKNPNFWDTLALGFSGMTLNPNQALIGAVSNRMQNRQQMAATEKQRNATADWLQSQGRADLAQAVRSGAIGGADALNLMQGRATKGVVVGDNLVNPETGEVIYQGGGGEMTTAVQSLDQRARLAGLDPGTDAYREFMIQGGAKSGIALDVAPDGSIRFRQGGDVDPTDVTSPSSPSAMVASIDGILNDPALDFSTGWLAWTQNIPGTEARRFGARAKQLSGQAFLQAFESLKGGGQITEIEGQKATDAIGRLDTAQRPEDYRAALKELRGILKDAIARETGQDAPDLSDEDLIKKYGG